MLCSFDVSTPRTATLKRITLRNGGAAHYSTRHDVTSHATCINHTGRSPPHTCDGMSQVIFQMHYSDVEPCTPPFCRCPLQDLVEELSAKALQEGALGLGTDRYMNSAKASAVLPDGADWRTVRVKFSRCSLLCKLHLQCNALQAALHAQVELSSSRCAGSSGHRRGTRF